MKTMSLRMPEELHKNISALAKIDRRSMNGQILSYIYLGIMVEERKNSKLMKELRPLHEFLGVKTDE